MAKRILVPLDETPAAQSVTEVVAEMARGGGATVRLLRVAPEPGNVMSGGHVVAYVDQEAARLEAEGLDALRAVEARLGGIPVECVVRFGDPAAEILREAEAFGADLIALTTKTASSLTRAVLGSVAEQVFRRAAVPVLLYRAARESAA